MKQPRDLRRTLNSVVVNGVLVVLGLGAALGSTELLLRMLPNLVPADVRVDPPVRRIDAFRDQTYDVKLSSGDLFYWMRGEIAPVPPDEDKSVAQVHFVSDANGFRNDSPERSTYDTVALGDSFTVGGNVASPWPQVLASYSGSAVLNLGEAGNGPQQELKLLRQHGIATSPRWVILAYFEGNDLYDAGSYAQASPFILPRFGRYIVERGLERVGKKSLAGAAESAESTYRYPITLTIADHDLQTAFFSYYIAWLSVSREALESSRNYELVEETILQMRDLSEASGARLLLVYVPSKEHVYLPYVNDADLQARVFKDVPTLELDEAGFLQFADKHATLELIHQHSDDQSNVLADFAAAQNINFLDLTSIFQDVAGTGLELYYPFDTHWNQDGHDLAARSMAHYMEVVP